MLKKSPENADGQTDGWTDGRTLPRHNTSFFKRAYKKEVMKLEHLGITEMN